MVYSDMGSKQAQFEALVQAYSGDLYRLAYWFCQNHSLADDLVQESYMRAWKSIDKLKDQKAAKAWLITILRREFARHCSNKHTRHLSIEELDLDQLPGVQRDENTPEYELLRRALAGIPDEYRAPLLLQVIGGYTGEEIAAILELSVAAVMTRLFRARKKLKSCLQANAPLLNMLEKLS